MAAPGDPLFPDGNESNPVIRWVDKAIRVSRALLRKKHPKYADDPYYIMALAVTVLANTREHAVGKKHPYCTDMSLAYADHYMQMRVEAFNLGPKARGLVENTDLTYDGLKLEAMQHHKLRKMKTGVCAPSPLTLEEMLWAKRGLEDGLKDYKKYPPDSIIPFRHPINFLVTIGSAVL